MPPRVASVVCRARRPALTPSPTVAAWYGISVSFTMFNKWLLRYWHNGAFNLPVTATAVHMGVKWLLART